MNKGDNPHDPRGLIFESYRIENIGPEECRSIFLDWALGQQLGTDITAALKDLIAEYGPDNPDHPMTKVLTDGLASAAEPRRRGGRAGRV